MDDLELAWQLAFLLDLFKGGDELSVLHLGNLTEDRDRCASNRTIHSELVANYSSCQGRDFSLPKG